MKKRTAILLTLFTFLPLCSCGTTDVNALTQEEQIAYLNKAIEKTSKNYTCVVNESATVKVNGEKTYGTSESKLKANKRRMRVSTTTNDGTSVSSTQQFYAFKSNEVHQYAKNSDNKWGKAIITYDFFYNTQIPNLNVNTSNVFTYEDSLFKADTTKLNFDLLKVLKTIYYNSSVSVDSASFEYYYIVCKNDKVESINCSYTMNGSVGLYSMSASNIVSFTYSKVGSTLVTKPFGLFV